MAETIDDKMNELPPHQAGEGVKENEKHAEKKQSTLESVIGEFTSAVRAGLNLSVAAAAPVAGYALTGNAGVLATSASYVAATKGKKDSKTIRNESLSGAIFGSYAHYTTLPLQYLSKIGKLFYMIPWVFGANAFYIAVDHLIKEKSPKGLYKKFKENYWPIVKKAFTLPAPLNILSALFLPQQYLVAATAVTSYLFRRFVAGGKGEEHTDKTPYYIAAPNVAYKLVRNTTKGLSEAIYAIGSTLGSYLTSPAKSPAPKLEPKPAAPEPAPAQPTPAAAPTQ